MVRLEEGKPPKDYYEWRREKSPEELLEEHIKSRREELSVTVALDSFVI